MNKVILVLVSTLLIAGTYAQYPFPTGGYQGGMLGNAKEKTWTGAVDEHWNLASNWCPPGIPGAKEDVVIPAAMPAMPEVKVTGMSCNNILSKDGATLVIKPGYSLQVNGVMTVEGP